MKKNAHSRTFIQFVTQKSWGFKRAYLGADKGTSIPHSVIWDWLQPFVFISKLTKNNASKSKWISTSTRWESLQAQHTNKQLNKLIHRNNLSKLCAVCGLSVTGTSTQPANWGQIVRTS